MSQRVNRKRSRFSLREKLLLIGIGALVLVVGVLGVLTGLTALARSPRPKPTPVPIATPAPTSIPALFPSIQVSPGEAEPGRLLVVTGDGWMPGDETYVHLIAPTGDERLVAKATVHKDGCFAAAFRFPGNLAEPGGSSVLVRASSATRGDEVVALLLVLAEETPSRMPTAQPTPLASETPAPTAVNEQPPVAIPTVKPTSQPVVRSWRGEYYNNRYLAGIPAVTRDDVSVNFVWGAGAPAAELPVDTFSARWTRTLAFESGTYRFYALSDDGVRVWLDGVLIIDRWHDAPSVTYTVDRTLSAGAHTLRVEYYENGGTAQIRFWWERADGYPQWRGEYFSNPDLAGRPTLTQNDANINFSWGTSAPAAGLPADGFSARWTRSLWFDEAVYRYHAIVDDGVRLYVDDVLVIDSWQDGRHRELAKDWKLPAGLHTVRVEYYERSGDALIQVWWDKVGSYPDWRGEYWSNRSLSGSPALVRNDGALDFNWGWGSPAAGLPGDGFSARWSRTAQFDAATYRFHILVDDGARLYADDQLILDTWRDGGRREVTRDHALTRGAHTLRVEYYEQTGEARIRVWWEKVKASYPDWKGEYWPNRRFDGKPALVRNDKSIDFRWGSGAVAPGLPLDGFSVRWSRKMSFDHGVYRFYAWADDGIRVYVDGELVLNEWHDANADEVYVVDLNLAGQKTVAVEYYERGGEALAKFWWKRVGDWPTPTPTATPTATPTSTPEPTATPTVEPTATPTSTPTPTVEPTATPTATPEPTPTPTQTPEPQPTGVRINEVLPVPAQDGIIDELDEWIELYNPGPVAVDLSGWFLDDGEGGSEPYRFPQEAVIPAAAFTILHGRTTGLVLDDTGDAVRLLDPEGAVADAVVFGQLAPNASYSRDEAGSWHDDWPPSPGSANLPPGLEPLAGIDRIKDRWFAGAQRSPWPANVVGHVR